MPTVREQLRNNVVAIISLVVALSSLGYNTWRNERTERNRNIRNAGFEILTKLGDLQQVVFFAHYGMGEQQGDARVGWAQVLTIKDLAQVVPERVPTQAYVLYRVWEEDFDELGGNEAAHQRIDRAIDDLRSATLETLGALD